MASSANSAEVLFGSSVMRLKYLLSFDEMYKTVKKISKYIPITSVQIDIRRHPDNLLSSHSLTKANADCIYQEYLRLKGDYLDGKLQKSTLRTLNKMRIEEERLSSF